MKPVRLLPPLAILLAMSACNGAASSDNVAANADLTANDTIANDEMAAENIDEGDASAEVAPLPAPPNDLSADDAAPLVQATQVAAEIAQDSSVERVPYQDGWAWRRNGQIIRTASRDGTRVSYFRPGESAPFYVQQGDRGFAYSRGQPRRAYDRSGHAAQVDAARRAEAERLAQQSRREREEAQRAPSRPTPDRNRPGRPDANDGNRHDGDHARPDGDHRPNAGNNADHRPNAGGNDGRRPGAGTDRTQNDRRSNDRRRAGSDDDDQNGNRLGSRGH